MKPTASHTGTRTRAASGSTEWKETMVDVNRPKWAAGIQSQISGLLIDYRHLKSLRFERLNKGRRACRSLNLPTQHKRSTIALGLQSCPQSDWHSGRAK